MTTAVPSYGTFSPDSTKRACTCAPVKVQYSPLLDIMGTIETTAFVNWLDQQNIDDDATAAWLLFDAWHGAPPNVLMYATYKYAKYKRSYHCERCQHKYYTMLVSYLITACDFFILR